MFIPPSSPGTTLDIPVESTATQIAALRYAHTTASILFNKYDRTDKSLCQHFLSDIDKLFVRSLRHFYVRYATVSTRDSLKHLYATYANILPSDLQENETHFCAPYDSNHPIETLNDQVETDVEYAADGNTPYSPAEVVATANQLVFQTGLFNNNCKFWKRKADAYKTWENFRVGFANAHQEWRESQATSACGPGFQSTNIAHHQDTIDAFASLAISTASNRHQPLLRCSAHCDKQHAGCQLH